MSGTAVIITVTYGLTAGHLRWSRLDSDSAAGGQNL